MRAHQKAPAADTAVTPEAPAAARAGAGTAGEGPVGEGNGARAAALLERGDGGRKVTRAQDQLVALGLLSAEARSAAAGVFDGATKRAVKAAQLAAGLPATGALDGPTLDHLTRALAAQTAASGVPAPLTRGDEGPQVERLQRALHGLGLFPDKAMGQQAGRFTGKTAAAVKGLQARAGLAPTGAVDGPTWAALRAEAGPEALWGGAAGPKGLKLTGSPPLRPGKEGPIVEELERLLASYGAELDPNPVFDRETRDAVRAFQAANGLTVDGVVNTATASALTSGTAAPARAAAPAAPVGGEAWLLQFLMDQGLEGDLLRTVWAIGMRESGGTPGLTTHGGEEDWDNPKAAAYDVGVFQVNSVNLPTVQELYGPDADMRLMLDPVKNYAVSARMSNGWRNLLPWGLRPDGSFDWSYYMPEWLAKYQATSEANFRMWFAAFERVAG